MTMCLAHENSASVLVAFTGGQMGSVLLEAAQGVTELPCRSRMDENGDFVNENDTPSMLIHDLLSLHRMDTHVDVKEFRPLVDGPDITDRHWTTIACMIGEHYLTYDGFVVVMGTDTLAYTGSALSFMLENLGGASRQTCEHLLTLRNRQDCYTNRSTNPAKPGERVWVLDLVTNWILCSLSATRKEIC